MAEKHEPQDPAPAAGPNRLTPVDVQQKQFRLAFRGYNEREVDEFLDQVTEELARLHAENRRWQEELGSRRTMPLSTGEPVEVERIVSQARQDAGRILAEAEAEARALVADARRAMADLGAVGTTELGTAAAGAGDFLGREKEFLQRLAGIIQEHAEAVKRDLRRVREGGEPTPPATIETGPEAAEASISGVTRTAPFGAEPSTETAYEAPVSAEPQPAPVEQPEPPAEPEPVETAWTPSKPEVEVVQSAPPLEEPSEAPWESAAVVEPAVEPDAFERGEPAEPPVSEPVAPQPAQPEPSPPEPYVPAWSQTQEEYRAPAEPEPQPEPEPEPEPQRAGTDAEPAAAWTSPRHEDSSLYPLQPEPEPEPETASPVDAGSGEEDAGPEVTPEPAPTPSWEPTTQPGSWGDPQREEAPETEEPSFEQPTLTGEPGPRPPESRPEPEDDAPQAFKRGLAGVEDEDEGEDRSLRELFWGED
jgi:DivIVA domain-containing protein